MIANTQPKTHVHHLLDNDVLIVNQANCVLARLWRMLLYRERVSFMTWDNRLDKYHRRCKSVSDEPQGSLKGNMVKQLAKETLTWYNFSRGISVIDYRCSKLVINITKGDVTINIVRSLPFVVDDDNGQLLLEMWKTIYEGIGITEDEYSELLTEFAHRFKRELGGDRGNSIRGNLEAALANKERMTWQTFYRGIMALSPDTLEYGIRLHKRKEVVNLFIDKMVKGE